MKRFQWKHQWFFELQQCAFTCLKAYVLAHIGQETTSVGFISHFHGFTQHFGADQIDMETERHYNQACHQNGAEKYVVIKEEIWCFFG